MAQVDDSPSGTERIEAPAKVVRVATMVNALLEELRQSHLDEGSCEQLHLVYESAVRELTSVLSADLRSELGRMRLSLPDGPTSQAQLRIAHAQLVGWLEGLLHGLQAAVTAQQLTNQAGSHGLENQAGQARLESSPQDASYL